MKGFLNPLATEMAQGGFVAEQSQISLDVTKRFSNLVVLRSSPSIPPFNVARPTSH